MPTTKQFEEEENLDELVNDIELWLSKQEYEVQKTGEQGEYLLQAKKTSGLRTFTGTNQALTIRVEGESGSFEVEVGVGKWQDNITGAGLSGFLTLGITWATGAAGAAWMQKIKNNFWEWLDERYTFGKNSKVNTPSESSGETESDKSTSEEDPATKAEKYVQEKLAELKDAHDAGILTEEEFKKKKDRLEDEKREKRIDFLVESRKSKLEEAHREGVLTEEEYKQKINNLRQQVINELKIEDLQEAHNNGILTEEEFQNKKRQLLEE